MNRVGLSGGSAWQGLQGLLLAFPIALFTGALVTDIVYLKTAEIQWTNFSAWLISGALVFNGAAIATSLAALAFTWRRDARTGRIVFLAILAAMFVLGLINAFKHSQDAWSSVGALGVILSVLCTLLAMIAGYLAYSGSTLVREDAR